MITFNDLLRVEGVDVDDVHLVRHQDARSGRRSIYEIWRNARPEFERYQSIQKKDRFGVGDTVAAFVVTPPPERETLFVGLYRVDSVGRVAPGTKDPVGGHDVTGLFEYAMRLDSCLVEYVGRLSIDWGQGFLAWHQRAARQAKPVAQIKDRIEEPFPGFDEFSWDVERIDEMYPTWKEVLRRVKGVYVLVDRESGAQYVGSATGDESLFRRFQSYAKTGHGGNVELRRRGKRRYRASVLQIASFDEEIIRLESAWKRKLMSREHGLNAN